MRATVYLTAYMPIDWDEFVNQTNQLTASLDNPTIQGASYQERDQREGTGAALTLRITGEVAEPEEELRTINTGQF